MLRKICYLKAVDLSSAEGDIRGMHDHQHPELLILLGESIRSQRAALGYSQEGFASKGRST